jgi:hypothetical protein
VIVGAAIDLPYHFEPRFYQEPIFVAREQGKKRIIAVWHRRAGKEKTFINLCACEMLDRVGAYYYFFPTYAQAKKAIWDGRDRAGFAFRDHFPKQLIKRTHKNDMLIEYRNGSIFQLVGSDNIDSVMSTNPVGCVFAEYSLQDPAGWEYMRPILRENGGWAAFDFTPRGKNHAFKLYEMAKNNPDWFVSRLTIHDTGALTQEDIEAERREGVSEEMIQQEYFVSFAGVMEGAYYGRQLVKAEADGRMPKTGALYDESIGVETWWDIGMDDAMSIWFTQTVGHEVRVINYLENSGETMAWYAKELNRQPYTYLSHNGPHDLNQRDVGSGGADRPLTTLEVAAKLGIKFRLVPMLGVDEGINAARAFLARCRFDLSPPQHPDGVDRSKWGVERGVFALQSYHHEWDEKKKIFKSYPAHDWASHGADAFRYLSVGHRITRQRMADAAERATISQSADDQNENWMGG